MKISATACCKINIGLNIVSKREDGYHNLETIFYPVPLYDEITITDAESDGIDLAGHKLDGNPNDNLVLKAVRLLRENGYDVQWRVINAGEYGLPQKRRRTYMFS